MQPLSPQFGGVVIYRHPQELAMFYGNVPGSKQPGEIPIRVQVVRPGARPTPETGILYAMPADEIVLGHGWTYDSINHVDLMRRKQQYASSPIAEELTKAHFPGNGTKTLDKLNAFSPSGSLMQSWFGILNRYAIPDNHDPRAVNIWLNSYDRTKLNNDVYEYESTSEKKTATILRDRNTNNPATPLKFGGVVIYAHPEDLKEAAEERRKQTGYVPFTIPLRYLVVAPNEFPTPETGINHKILASEIMLNPALYGLFSEQLAPTELTQYYSSPIAEEITNIHFPKSYNNLRSMNRISPSGALMSSWFAQLIAKRHSGNLACGRQVESTWGTKLERTKLNRNVFEYKTGKGPNNFQSEYKDRA